MTTYRAIILHPFDVTFQAAAVVVALPHVANWFDHIAMTKLYSEDFGISHVSLKIRVDALCLPWVEQVQDDQPGPSMVG